MADTLESFWNQKLRELAEAQEEYERQCRTERFLLDEQQRTEILALATDFPRLWQDQHTPDRERKRMVHLMLEDVTLIKSQEITAHVRFKGGATRTLVLPAPLPISQLRHTDPVVLQEIDRLLDHHTDAEVAHILNERGLRSYEGKPFTGLRVGGLRLSYRLKDHFSRLRAAGMLTIEEMAKALGVCTRTVKVWHRRGLLRSYQYNDKGQCLFEPPDEHAPVKGKWKGNRHPDSKILSNER